MSHLHQAGEVIIGLLAGIYHIYTWKNGMCLKQW